jgi:hypothetical protein
MVDGRLRIGSPTGSSRVQEVIVLCERKAIDCALAIGVVCEEKEAHNKARSQNDVTPRTACSSSFPAIS